MVQITLVALDFCIRINVFNDCLKFTLEMPVAL